MNLSKSLHLSSFIPPTWYLIFILYIPPSLVYFLCSDHTAVYYYLPPCIFNRDYYDFLSIFCLSYFHLTPASVHFQQGFFLFKFSDFNFISNSSNYLQNFSYLHIYIQKILLIYSMLIKQIQNSGRRPVTRFFLISLSQYL